MTAPSKPRRCGCGRPATHRLKGGVNVWRMWTSSGVREVSWPVRNEALCGPCAPQVRQHLGGRVYRWRRIGAR